MLCSYYFNPVFTIFALSFVQVIDSNTEPKPQKQMDDITSFRRNTYCKFQANRYTCGKGQRGLFRYYYDVERNTCEPFLHGNCIHPYNMFSSLHSCNSECEDMNRIPTLTNTTENIFCRFQPEFGNCNSYHPRWYFDITEMACRGFSFSGCGGNPNNFENSHRCLDVCSKVIKQCKLLPPETLSEIAQCYT